MLSVILSALLHIYHGFVYVIFHPILYVGFKLGGDKARLKIVKCLNFFLHTGLYIVGASLSVKGKENLPGTDRPFIVVSNHQSLYDICIIGRLFAYGGIDFVAKSSLGKYIPSVSYNLRNGHSALVDRNNGAQSVREIFKFGRYIQANNTAACIFPEGTRTKDGKVNPFMPAGVATLVRASPSALIVPFVIEGHHELCASNNFVMNVGQKLEYTILPTIDPKGRNIDELVKEIETKIHDVLEA